jgi:hypothetical protein
MTWDMVLVTVTLVTVLLSIILLAIVTRIWQDETPSKPGTDSRHAQAVASRSAAIDRVTGAENSLA